MDHGVGRLKKGPVGGVGGSGQKSVSSEAKKQAREGP